MEVGFHIRLLARAFTGASINSGSLPASPVIHAISWLVWSAVAAEETCIVRIARSFRTHASSGTLTAGVWGILSASPEREEVAESDDHEYDF